MQALSVIILTKNEEKNIRRCLESVRFADEIIILDSGSEDATLAIADEFNAQVHQSSDWPGFGQQKNRALDKARHDWVFSIDADEVVTPALRDEIQTCLKSNPEHDGYTVRRQLIFNNKIIKYGPGENHPLRLFRREKAQFSNDAVHERLIVTGSTAALSQTLLHYSYHDLDDVIHRMNRYSRLSAQMKRQKGKRATLWTAVSHGAWMFIRQYFLKRGFLDGEEGFALAFAFAEGSYYHYMKLLFLSPDEMAVENSFDSCDSAAAGQVEKHKAIK